MSHQEPIRYELDLIVDGIKAELEAKLSELPEDERVWRAIEMTALVNGNLEDAWEGVPDSVPEEWIRPMIWGTTVMTTMLIGNAVDDWFGTELDDRDEEILFGGTDEEIRAAFTEAYGLRVVEPFISLRNVCARMIKSFGRGVIASAYSDTLC